MTRPLTQCRNDDYAIVIGQSLQLKGSWWLRQTTRHDAACRPFNPVDGLGLDMLVH